MDVLCRFNAIYDVGVGFVLTQSRVMAAADSQEVSIGEVANPRS